MIWALFKLKLKEAFPSGSCGGFQVKWISARNVGVFSIAIIALALLRVSQLSNPNTPNPSLALHGETNTPATTREPASMDAKRKVQGTLGELDYRFALDTTYRIHFHQLTELNAGAEKAKKMDLEGDAEIHPLGFEGVNTLAIARFNFKKIDSELLDFSLVYEMGNLSFDGKPKDVGNPYHNAVLVRINPRGKLEGFLSRSEDRKSMVPFYLSNILKSVIPLAPDSGSGTKVRMESYAGKAPFKMEYGYSTRGDSLVSEGVLVAEKPKVGAGKKSLLGFEQDQNRSVHLEWVKSKGVPSGYETRYHFKIGSSRGSLVKLTDEMTSSWKIEAGSPFKFEDINRFQETIDDAGMVNPMMALRHKRPGDTTYVFDDVVRQMKTDLSDLKNLTVQNKNEILDQVSNLLKENPYLLKNYRELMGQYPEGSMQRSILLGAMLYVNTPEVQGTLVDLYREVKGKESLERQKILAGFNVTDSELTPATKDFLRDVYQNGNDSFSRPMAGLALGATLSIKEDRALQAEIKADYQIAKTDFDRSLAVSMMGNSRSPAFLKEIVRSADADSVEERVTAAEALRHYSDGEARQKLFEMAQNDQALEVRRQAVRSFAYQPYDAMTRERLFQCSRSEKEYEVRKGCVDVLKERISDPDTRQFLTQMAVSETVPQLKQSIEGAIESWGRRE